MSLSCSCDYEPEPGATWSWWPDEFTEMPARKRRARCADKSCRRILNPGDVVGEFREIKVPESDVEVAIYGEDGGVPRASEYLCEDCAGLFFSLTDLGFCLDQAEVREALWEYQLLSRASGPQP